MCTNCEAGFAAPASAGLVACESCPAGRFSDRSGDSACELCATGTASYVSHVPSSNVGAVHVITLSNDNADCGSDPATDVFLTYAVATGVEYVYADGQDWSCTHDGAVTGGTVSCALSGSAAPCSATSAVAVAVADTGCASTADVVAWGSRCDVDGANTVSFSDFVTDRDLELSVSSSPAASMHQPGSSGVQYTLSLANIGATADAEGPVVLATTVPTGVTLSSYAAPSWACETDSITAGTLLWCTLSSTLVASGAAATVDLSLAVDSTSCGTYTLAASAATEECDPFDANNAVSVDIVANDIDVFVTERETFHAEPGGEGRLLVDFASTVSGVASVTSLPFSVTFSGFPDVLTLVYVSSTCTVLSVDSATQVATYTGSAVPGATVQLQMNYTVAAGACGDYTGTVTAASGAASSVCEGNSANDAFDWAFTIAGADLQVTGANTGAADVALGADAEVTFTVTNVGASSSTGAALVVSLPALSALQTMTGCASTAGTTCSLPDLAPGAFTDVVVTHTIGADACLEVVTSAALSSPTTCDGVATNDAASAVTGVLSANLTVTHASVVPTAARSTNTSYTVQVRNSGSVAAGAVELLYDMDAMVVLSATSCPGPWSVSGSRLTCAVGDLAAGATVDVVVSVEIDAAACGSVTQRVYAASPEACAGALASSTVAASTTVTAAASLPDLAAAAADGVAYALDVTNAGGAIAVNVTVDGTLDDNVAYVVASGTDWTCAHDGSPTGGALACSLARNVSAYGIAPELLVASVLQGTPCPGVNDSFVVSAVNAPNCDAANDHTDAATTIVGADVSLALQDDSAANGPFARGDTVQYTAVVSNAGPGAADDLVVVLQLDADMTFSSASFDALVWDCVSASGTVTCTYVAVAAVAANSDVDPIVMSVGVGAAACSSVTLSASVSSPSCDGVASNGAASVTTVLATADFAVSLQSSPTANVVPQADPLTKVTYVASLADVGSVAAATVDLTVVLDAAVSFTAGDVTGCTSTPAVDNSTLTCTVTLTTDTTTDPTAEVVIAGTVDPLACLELQASASVSTPCDDNAVNDAVVASTTLAPVNQAALSVITVTGASPGTVNVEVLSAGSDGSATADAANPVVVFTLPAGLAYVGGSVSPSPSVWSACTEDAAAATVTCALATTSLPFTAESRAEMAVEFVATDDGCGPYSVAVEFLSDTCDVTPGDALTLVTTPAVPALALTLSDDTVDSVTGATVPVEPLADFVYTASVANTGDGDVAAGHMQVVLELDAHVALVLPLPSSPWLCAEGVSGSGAPNVTCSYVQVVAAGAAAADLTLTATMGSGACGAVALAATVTTAGCNSGSAAAATAALATPVAVADLAIAMHELTAVGLTTCESCVGNSYSDPGAKTCTACPLGKVTDNFELCRDCPTGTFHAAASDTHCTSCVSGLFANVTGLSVCYTCDAGSFTNTTSVGRSTCTLCSAGKYAADPGATFCLPCVGNTVATAEGFTSCVDCALGEIVDGISCAQCPTGRYHFNQSSTTCDVCEAGFATPRTGTSGQCDSCPRGFFAAEPEQTACDECVAGTHAPLANMTTCLDCGDNNTVSVAAAAFECTTCAPGFVTTDQSACEACEAGTYHPAANSTVCAPCTPGLYTSEPAVFGACASCPPGNFSSDSLSTTCDPCAVGTYSGASGLDTCTECELNSKAASTGQSVCDDCDLGFVVDFRKTECQPCDENEFHNDTAAVECSQCAVGLFASGTGNSVCEPCAAGRFYLDAQCEDCPAGTYQPSPQSTTCLSCFNQAPNTISGTGATECTQCPEGEVTEAHTVCDPVPRGTFHAHPDNQTGTDCPRGRFAADPGLTECTECPLGRSMPNTRASACTLCSIGLFSDAYGLVDCLDCDGNSVAQDVGLTVCSQCDLGFRVTTLTSKKTCVACPVGRFHSSALLTYCTDCAPGSVQDALGQANCTLCEPGTFKATARGITCDECSANAFAAQFNSTTCTSCDSQPNTIPAVTFCDLCPFGETADETACEPCPTGRFHAHPTATMCTDCTRGTATDVEATNTSCPLCVPGFFQRLEGEPVCEECESGLFVDTYGASVCLECNSTLALTDAATNYTFTLNDVPNAASAADACILCPAGFLSDGLSGSASTSCTACSPGRYHAQQFHTFCTDCETGRYNNLQNATTCFECREGEHSVSEDNTGAKTSCTACPAGTFQNLNPDTGFHQCTTCIGNQFSSEANQTSCTECPPNELQVNHKSCKPCDYLAREYPVVNDTLLIYFCGSCRSDLSFTFTDPATGQLVPQSFPNSGGAGYRILHTSSENNTFDGVNGVPPCSACPPGKYFTDNSPASCTTCANGEITTESGLTACTSCNTVRPPEGNTWRYSISISDHTDCAVCDAGRYARNLEECVLCGVGSVSPQDSDRCNLCSTSEFENGERTECIACTEDGLDCTQQELVIAQGWVGGGGCGGRPMPLLTRV